MHNDPLLFIVGVVLIGTACQWIAWWLRMPAILPLLISGLILGPVTGLFNPDFFLGSSLLPIVSFSIALILFEGGMTLKISEVRGHGSVVSNLITIGAIVTWLGISYATHVILDFSYPMSFLFGAIVVVSGPTVVIPILRTVRLSEKLSSILRWEGILIDPIGAIFAVLVYEFLVIDNAGLSIQDIFFTFAQMMTIGVAYGFLLGKVLETVLHRYFIPEYLRSVFSLALVSLCFIVSNYTMHESGLLAVTIMGMILGNSKKVVFEDISSFKESISVLLISALFIVLAARISFDQMLFVMNGNVFFLIAVIILVVRPIAVWISSIGTTLNWREKIILSWINPRGIVAAAIASSLTLKLEDRIYASEAEYLLPLTFFLIITTVVLQGLTAKYLAAFLKVREPAPNGLLIFGSNRIGRVIAKTMQEQGIRVLLADSLRGNLMSARMNNLETFHGNLLSEYAQEHLDLSGIGKLLALSGEEQHDGLICSGFKHEFGHNNVFQLYVSNHDTQKRHGTASRFYGHRLFGDGVIFSSLLQWFDDGGEVKVTNITKEFSYGDYLDKSYQRLVPLFFIDPDKMVHPVTSADTLSEPVDGWRVVSLFKLDDDTI